MATTLVVPWAELLPSSEPANPLVPSIELLLIGREGLTWKANFLVDSGADISLAPRALCERLGLVWDAGQPMLLNGISERPECAVPTRIFEVELLIPDLALALDIPICFAEGNASLNRSHWVQRLDEPLPSPILRQQRQASDTVCRTNR